MSKKLMTLTGDANLPDMPMTDSEVNHLRRLLGWMQTEYTLSEHAQAGVLDAANFLVQSGFATVEQGQKLIAEKSAQINQVPAYLRQAIKMLTKALREHEAKSGVIEEANHD